MYLPIGTLVLLKDATVKVMIIGYKVKEAGSERVYDYLGCPYPLGVIESDKNLMFDHMQIMRIVYMGFSDDSFDIVQEHLI